MSELALRFSGKKVYLVVSFADENTDKKSFLSTTITDATGKVIWWWKIDINADGIYTVFDGEEYVPDATLQIYAPNTRPVRLHAFTFWD